MDWNLNLSEADEIKLAELAKLNLPRAWLDIAKTIGPDNLIVIWKIFSTPEYQTAHKSSIYVPSINKYYEYQKIQMIKQAMAAGLENAAISAVLKKSGFSACDRTLDRYRQKFNLVDVNK